MSRTTADIIITNVFNDILRECIANSYENRQNRSVVDVPALNLILSNGKERLKGQIDFLFDKYEELKHKDENDWRIPDDN